MTAAGPGEIALATPRGPLRAYLAPAAGTLRGGIVLAHEIYGLDAYVEHVADRLAAAGYGAIAPAFFEHGQAPLHIAHTRGGAAHALALARRTAWRAALADVCAAAVALGSAVRVAIVGFSWGGTLALLAAQRLALPAVSYYATRNAEYLTDPLAAPALFHFGANDAGTPAALIARHRRAFPRAEVYVYPRAGHGFDRDRPNRRHYRAASAQQAWQRTLAFLDRTLAAGPGHG